MFVLVTCCQWVGHTIDKTTNSVKSLVVKLSSRARPGMSVVVNLLTDVESEQISPKSSLCGTDFVNIATHNACMSAVQFYSLNKRFEQFDGFEICRATHVCTFQFVLWGKWKTRSCVQLLIQVHGLWLVSLIHFTHLTSSTITAIWLDGWSLIQVRTDELTQVHSARHSLVVIHPSTNRGRWPLISVNVPLS